jgi:hypothetical protein
MPGNRDPFDESRPATWTIRTRRIASSAATLSGGQSDIDALPQLLRFREAFSTVVFKIGASGFDSHALRWR